ncbi:MAG: PAS domain S-box protein [Anaerolineae bacterium]
MPLTIQDEALAARLREAAARQRVSVEELLDDLLVRAKPLPEQQREAPSKARITVYTNDRDLKYTWIYNSHPDFPPAEMVGKRDEDLLPLGDVAELVELKREVLADGERREREIATRINGEDYTFAVLVEPMRADDGTVSGVLVATIDISDTVRIHDQLDKQQTFTQSILSTMPSIVYVWDVTEGRVHFVSEYVRQALGYTPGEIIESDESPLLHVHPDDRDGVAAHLETVTTAPPGETLRWESRMQHRDGSWRWFATQNTVLSRGDGGQVLTILGVARDITERKQAEAQLRQNAERLQLAKQAAQLGIYDYDIDNDVIDWDARTRELWGVAANELITYATFREGLHPDDRSTTDAAVQRSFKPDTDGRYYAEFRVVHRTTGSIRWIAANGRTYFKEGRPYRLVGTVQDITAYRSLQERLQLALAEYRSMAESMPQLVWTTDANGSVDYYNSQMLEYGGITRTEDGTWTWQPVLHPEDEEPTLAAWQAALAAQEPYAFEHRLQMKDGSYRWHISKAVPAQTGPEGAIKWYGTATDIHETKMAQEALRESEERFRNMADHAPVMVWVTDASGACTYISQSWYEFTGQPPDSALGLGWLQALHPDDIERSKQRFLTANAQQEDFQLEYRLRRADGVIRWAIDSAQPRFSESGEFLGYIGSVIDITERKQQEQLVEQQREGLQQLINKLPVMITIYTLDTRVIYVNREFERITGWTNAQLQDVDIMEVVYPDEDIRADARRFMESVEPGWREFPLTRSDGDLVSTQWANILLPDGRQVGIGLDLTERKRNEVRSYQLMYLTKALSEAVTIDDVIRTTDEYAFSALGSLNGVIALRSADDDMVDLIFSGYATVSDQVRETYARVPVETNFPVMDALRSGEPIWIETEEQYRATYPQVFETFDTITPTQAFVCLPLRSGSTVVGALGAAFLSRREFSMADRNFMLSVAEVCAQAVTRARLYEAEREARQEAEEANELKTQFLGMISHEQRTPLASIKGFATTLLADDVTWNASEQRDFLAIINQESDKLHGLVGQLLDVAQLQAGRLSIAPGPVPVQALLEDVQPQL